MTVVSQLKSQKQTKTKRGRFLESDKKFYSTQIFPYSIKDKKNKENLQFSQFRKRAKTSDDDKNKTNKERHLNAKTTQNKQES